MIHCINVPFDVKRLSAVVPQEEYRRILKLVRAGEAKSIAEFPRTVVKAYARKMGSSKLLSFREVSLE